MKFLFVSEFYEPHIMGGAVVSLKILVDELVGNKHEVTVFTPNYDNYKTEISKNGNLKIIRFKSPRYFLYRNREDTSHKVYGKSRRLFYFMIELYKNISTYEFKIKINKILKEDFDYIHTNSQEMTLALKGKKTKAKKITHFRDFSAFCYNRGLNKAGVSCEGCSVKNIKICLKSNMIISKFLFKILQRRKRKTQKVLKEFDKYFSISKYVEKQFKRNVDIDLSKSSVLYNPISKEIISSLTKQDAKTKLNLKGNIMLYVGSLTEEKGVHLLPDIAKKVKDYKMVVIGDGPLKNVIENEKSIDLKGYINTSELKDYYRAADILLVPSVWNEPFGRVIIEGAANGCFVIGSTRGAIPEVIDHFKCGEYTDPNVDSIVKTITNHNKKIVPKIEYDYYKSFMKLLK